jgi:hypothetical protein
MPGFDDLQPKTQLDPLRVSHPRLVFPETSDSARREGLEPALEVLDEVNPTVAEWVRQMLRERDVIFTDRVKICDGPSGHLAKYDVFRRELTISRGLFAENDGTIAAVLCHEYRHARQRFPKTMVYALSFLLTKDGDAAIIENDALLYEQEANLAIFGKYQKL